MADEPTLGELQRSLDRLSAEVREVKALHVTERVFLAMHQAVVDRVTRLEQSDTAKSSGTRQWGLGLIQTVIGVILGAIAGVLTAKGGK